MYRSLCRVQVGMVRDFLVEQAREAENEAMKNLVPLYKVKSKEKVIGE